MPGPAPKPTALKLLQGNPGKRKLNDQEPKPVVGAVAPKYVQDSPVLLAEWNRHAPRLTKLKLLTEIDDDALATLCVLELRFKELVAEEGSTSALSFLSKEKRALWSRFGMTPADRSRVKVGEPEREQSKLEKLRAR
jgi:phage terminase small subunit